MFLEKGYEPAAAGGNYLNKFAEGDTKIRILSDAVVGWVYWVKSENSDNNEPVRLREAPEVVPAEAVQDKFGGLIKEFWAFVVWNYEENRIQLCEIVQATIKNPIFDLHNNKEWGNPQNYDITINKKKENDRTSYAIIPSPPTDVPLEVAEEFAKTPITLEALFTNDDPFKVE